MNDKDMLELAAKAAGMELPKHLWKDYKGDGLKKMSGIVWNPLKNDGDALWLAVKLRLELVSLKDTIVPSRAVAWKDGTAQCCLWEPENDDPFAATRRAIVRAAAEIGKSL